MLAMGQPNSKLYKKQILQWMEVIDCEQEINYDWPSIIAQKNIYANFNFFKG